MEKIAIIITAYNRATSLKNLLNSLNNVIRLSFEVPLIISIDNGGTPEVNQLAQNYNWKHGRKEVIIHPHKKGLVKHFLWVGDQTELYENIIFLEDDLLVSPELLRFSIKIIDFYKDEIDIAGASLYNPPLCELTGTKFYQLQDGNDVYFLQQPYWGNIWFRNKWIDFKKYLENYIPNKNILPYTIAEWKESFKKIYVQYLVEEKKSMVTPRISLVTNNGDIGLHSVKGAYQYQTILMNHDFNYRLCKYKNSSARYDAFMEIEADILKHSNHFLSKYDFVVDTKGVHLTYDKPYVITNKSVKTSICNFSEYLKPTEIALVYNILGEGVSLAKKEDVVNKEKYAYRLYKDIDKNYMIGIKVVSLLLRKTIIEKLYSLWHQLIY